MNSISVLFKFKQVCVCSKLQSIAGTRKICKISILSLLGLTLLKSLLFALERKKGNALSFVAAAEVRKYKKNYGCLSKDKLWQFR